jgi:hypothetical protein
MCPWHLPGSCDVAPQLSQDSLSLRLFDPAKEWKKADKCPSLCDIRSGMAIANSERRLQ